jgi:HK97 family phage portal protein
MGLLDSVRHFLALEPLQPSAMQTRGIDSFVDHPGLNEQLLAIQGLTPRPWRPASVKEALGVPAILRAVTLIANTGGSMSMRAYRRGLRLPDEERPRVIVRPDPFRIPFLFYRDTFQNMASLGEAWWWVAKRDSDGGALSLLNVPPHEVTVEEDPRDLRYPIIRWRDQKMPNDDMIQIPYMQLSGDLRGVGPLQLCGAATSVAVEAQEWAANFYASGGYPNLLIQAAGELSGGDEDSDGESEAQRLKNQWISTPPNTPKVIDEGIAKVEQFDPNPQGAQMLEAREFNNGDAARMFGINGSLLDYRAGGSNLTYQNLEQEMTKFLRTCMLPNYLESVEQTMSDLLTRSTVARFNVDAVNRADIKTRFEVYEIASRVLPPDEAAELLREQEGIVPGDVENAPMPFAPPAAVPDTLPIQRRAYSELRCDGTTQKRYGGVPRLTTCNKLLSESGLFVGTCPRCKKVYDAA